jgi:hypothetical protein
MIRLTALALATTVGFLFALPVHAFIDPPAKYVKPYPGGTTKYYFPKAKMVAKCTVLLRREVHPRTAGCASSRSGRCIIYMAQEVRLHPEVHRRFYDHELAHCNGWTHARPE